MAALTDESIGLANETAPGTYAAPTRFYEWSDGSHEWNPSRVQGAGLRVGSAIPRSARRVTPKAEGQVELTVEAISKGMGLLWESCIGSGTSTVVTGATYQQVFTLPTGTTLPSRTLQVGAIRADGTVDPVSYVGCTASEWEFELADEIATLKVTFDASKIDTAQSYASPSYPSSPTLFHRANAAMTLGDTVTFPTTTALATGGTAVTNVRSFKLSGSNNLAADRFNLVGNAFKARQLRQGPSITGELSVEYDSTTVRDAFLNDTETMLSLTISGAALSSGNETLQFACIVKFDGSVPSRAGGELNVYTAGFTVVDNLTNPPLAVAMRTADTAL